MPPRVTGLTGATLHTAPSVCHDCVWWQSRAGGSVDKERWRERAESEWGAWGTLYVDDDGRLLGSMQCGPASLFPRAAELPAGPPSRDAVLVTCAYLADSSTPWVMQSLFLAAIGDARDRDALALETLGFFICTFIFVGLLLKVVEPQPWKVAIVGGLIAAVSSDIVFNILLQSRIPSGLFGY